MGPRQGLIAPPVDRSPADHVPSTTVGAARDIKVLTVGWS